MKSSGGENSAIFLIGEYAMDLTKKKKNISQASKSSQSLTSVNVSHKEAM